MNLLKNPFIIQFLYPLFRDTTKFWGSGLWSKGYYVGTAGTVTAETIQKYRLFRDFLGF
jgi:REP element-mobilizing transposase RayT